MTEKYEGHLDSLTSRFNNKVVERGGSLFLNVDEKDAVAGIAESAGVDIQIRLLYQVSLSTRRFS